MASKAQDREPRRAAAAVLRAEQERAERRRRRVLVAVVAGVVLALVIPVGYLLVTETQEQARLDEAAANPIAGEREIEVPSADHVTGDVPYETATPTDPPTAGTDKQAQAQVVGAALPPLGGAHDSTPQNCGFYDQPVRAENAVHSLEHGAVWLAFRADLDDADVARIKELARTTPNVLASPYEDLAAPVVATAWGVQLELEDTSDERLDAFLARYVQGEQTPEPGAPCSGGVGSPIA